MALTEAASNALQEYRDAVLFRAIPTARVAEFIRNYMSKNYSDQRPMSDFAHDAGLNGRYVHRILEEDNANVSFDVVDRLFTKLECMELWHLPAEEGGFADYYYPDDPPAPAKPNLRQSRIAYAEAVYRAAKKKGVPQIDEAHERALADDEARAA